ncbi:MAG TPA: RNA 2'-phosphotransferase [Thermoplasmata archaeon]|nr:RNA 2'-phosphotransferase [Thermoplasmata archaeon]
MLRKCQEHGFYRGSKCQFCGKEGKLLLNENQLIHLGRILTGILRHFPEKFGLNLDRRGWLKIADIVSAVKEKVHKYHWLTIEHIKGIAETDEKGRYEIRTGKIRATYGHSRDVDLDLPKENIPKYLYYPVKREHVEKVKEEGISPFNKSKVHLSATPKDALEAGSIHFKNPVILRIRAKECVDKGEAVIQKAGKYIFIADFIPGKFVEIYEEK